MISSGLRAKDKGISRYLMGYGGLAKCSNELIVEQIIILGRKQMEGLQSLNFQHQLTQSLKDSKLMDQNLDLVTLHCRRDHISPSFHQTKSSSCYKSSYTPAKDSANYNQTEVQKGLHRFRKYQNSTNLLPTITKVSESSHYQNAYHGHSQEKPQRGHQKQSFFLKYNWALDPTSNYQKDYLNKNGSDFNKNNAERVNHNNLTIVRPNQSKKDLKSNYRNDFKVFTIKKEAELTIGAKDHLKSSTKENNIIQNISEYQRRYDSVMEFTKHKDPLMSIYKKDVISRKPKVQ